MRNRRTRLQLVLWLLIRAVEAGDMLIGKANGIMAVLALDGWLKNWAICSVEVGGIAGLRRLRDLKANGIEIAMMRYRDKDGKPTGTFCYKLITPVRLIDTERCCLRKGVDSARRTHQLERSQAVSQAQV